MRPTHRWVIIYDISDAKRLARVAQLMESYGVRIQRSVFEVLGQSRLISEIRDKITMIIEEPDSVVYIPLCRDDCEKTERYGTLEYPGETNDGDGSSLFL